MISIPLTKGYRALIDDEDAYLTAFKWCATIVNGRVYAQRAVRRSDGRKTTEKLHTAVTGRRGIDHINGDGLDCRRGNLRLATQSENMANQGIPRNNTSGFKGVICDRSNGGRWKAQIKKNQRLHSLGYFSTREEAARAYDAAARRLFGEFARVNLAGH